MGDARDFKFDRYARVPDSMWAHLREGSISQHAALLYVFFCGWAGGNVCCKSHVTIARELGKATGTVSRAHKQLEEAGLVKRWLQPAPTGNWGYHTIVVKSGEKRGWAKIPQIVVKLKLLSTWDRITLLGVLVQTKGQYKEGGAYEIYHRGTVWLADFLGRNPSGVRQSFGRLSALGFLERLERIPGETVCWGIPNLRRVNILWHKEETKERQKSTEEAQEMLKSLPLSENSTTKARSIDIPPGGATA